MRWGEATTYSLQLNATPLAIGIFRKQMSGHPRAWIFTSATLAVQKDFGHYCRDGANRCRISVLGQPSTTARRPCSTRRRAARAPTAPGFIETVADAAFPVVRRAAAVPLFQALRSGPCAACIELLQDKLEAAGLDYPLLLQGEGSRTNCSNASVGSATPSPSAARAAGKASTYAARRSPGRHRQPRLRRRTTWYCRRASSA